MAATEIKVQMQQRRDTAAGWTSAGTVLLAGELGYETDTGYAKLGDGSTAWGGLDYLPAAGKAPDGTQGAPGISFQDDLDTGFYRPSGNEIGFSTGGLERFRLDNSGRLLLNASSNIGGLGGYDLQVAGVTVGNSSIAQALFENDNEGPIHKFFHSRGANIDAQVAVVNNDQLGDIQFHGSDGTNIVHAARILCNVDGTPGTNDMPGRITFQTTADGASSPTERVRIDSSGRVGIGTTSPTNPLTVVGTSGVGANAALRLEDESAQGVTIGIENDGDVVVDYLTKDLAIAANDSEKLRINSSGNVGIGTTSPSSPLHISSSEDRLLLLQSSDANAYLAFQDSDSSSNAANRVGTVSDGLYFNTGGGGERVRIDSSGRLLVGTSSSSASTAAVFQGNSFDSGQPNQVYFQRDTAGTSLSAGDGIGFLLFADNAGNVFSQIGCQADAATGSSDYPGRLIFYTTADGASSPTERVRIDSSGNVGIGHNDPPKQLSLAETTQPTIGLYTGSTIRAEINATSAETSFLSYANSPFTFNIGGSAETEAVRIDSSGRVLVGHSSSIDNAGVQSRIQVIGDNAARASIGIRRDANDANGPLLIFGKSRSGALGNNVAVSNNDVLGLILFCGGDGTDVNSQGAEIKVQVDGTPGSNDLPTRIVLGTTADGASSPTEHFRIASNGDLTATDTTIGSNSDSRLKTNIADFLYSLEDFKQYRPKTFDWKNPEIHGNAAGQRGFIAQDVEAVDSYWVSQQEIDEDSADAQFLDEDRIAKTLKLGKKDAMYISVIQQLLTKIETLEIKVAALEAQ